ncbi:hypothetical protein HDZ31DRAFT_63458 [Schizophyllum fasciatum]
MSDRESIERPTGVPSPEAALTLKRKASPSFDAMDDPETRTGKRRREETPPTDEEAAHESASARQNRLADELALDLQCGCCSDLVINPVIVLPCQHFFCGSCVVQWIKNGGTNCPGCRSVSASVAPFRTMQAVVDTLLRIAPEKARPERERQQADAIYRKGSNLRIPVPRTASPEPNLNPSTDFARPCPHCAPHNPYGWQCPRPIADPNTEPDNAWPLDDGLPPGHGHCGNCENLMALGAPTSSKCDFCHVHFCGIAIQGRCQAASVLNQQPHGMTDVADLIQSADVYECFDSNYVEVEIMLDYLTAQQMTPRHIYREIVMHVQTQPRGFQPLVEQGLFMDSPGLPPSNAPADAPRRRICRVCASEILLWGIRDWWVRERSKGFLEEHILARKDCPQGTACENQKNMAHAREFNHIFAERAGEGAGPSREREVVAVGEYAPPGGSVQFVPPGEAGRYPPPETALPRPSLSSAAIAFMLNDTEPAAPSHAAGPSRMI